jgi:hypothetical protein
MFHKRRPIKLNLETGEAVVGAEYLHFIILSRLHKTHIRLRIKMKLASDGNLAFNNVIAILHFSLCVTQSMCVVKVKERLGINGFLHQELRYAKEE